MEQSTPTATQGNRPRRYIPYLLLLPFLLFPPLFLFSLGYTKWAFITLAILLPVPFVIGLGSVAPRIYIDPRLYEIYNHMTKDERRQANRMGMRAGAIFGCIGGLLPGAFQIVCRHILGWGRDAEPLVLLIGLPVMFLIIIPMALRERRKFARFALTTKYAKDKGWNTI